MKIKIIKSKSILVFLMGLVVWQSCTQEDLSSDYLSSLGEKINLGAFYPLLSRATDEGFEDHDQMGVFVVDYENEKPGTPGETNNRASNVRYTFHETDNSWKGDVDVYWKDAKTPVDIYGYYPYQESNDTVSSWNFFVAENQNLPSKNGGINSYQQSDFLWAKQEKIYPTKERISLSYKHKMAGISVVLQKGSGFTEEEWKKSAKTVMITNTVTQAVIDFSQGVVRPEGTICKSIVPYYYNETYRAVVIPQQVQAGKELMNVTIDGSVLSYKRNEAMNYQSGQLHRFTFQVNKKDKQGEYEFKLIEEKIEPWIDDPHFHDGVIREYVIVDLAKGESLENKLKELHKDASQLQNLKLTGFIDEADFHFMKTEMPTLNHLNMKEVVITNENGEPTNTIPYEAFYQCKLLTKVVLPDRLHSIDESAFSGTGLRGSLHFPEGLKTIKKYAFASCESLYGDLTFPSSLDTLGMNAFSYTGLTGSVMFPSTLKFIGYECFRDSHLSGNLILPDELEYLGTSAFYNNDFTGDLQIPHKIKNIGHNTFASYREGFQGNLILPEGIEEIGLGAFSDCHFRGELVLPTTLKYLNDEVFMNNDFLFVSLNPALQFMGARVFSGCKRLSGMISIPDKIVGLREGAFENCIMLEGIHMGNQLKYIQSEAFRGCYGLESILIENEEPPIINAKSFYEVPKDNFSVEVPSNAVATYRNSKYWKEFKRITAHRDFVCRPADVCALNKGQKHTLILNAKEKWQVKYLPSWCTLSESKGDSKTELLLTINDMSHGNPIRKDSIVFQLEGKEIETYCHIQQLDYEHAENEILTLQQATKGKGVNILVLGDGFDAESISNGTYLEIVKKQMEQFFGIEPYRTYRDYFNVYAFITLSQENGINSINSYKNTRFNVMYGGCVEYKLRLDENSLLAYLDECSTFTREQLSKTLIVVVPNTKDYSGQTYLYDDGMAISLCPPGMDEEEMRINVQREAGGFGFGKLGNEQVELCKYLPVNIKRQVEHIISKGWYRNLSLSGNVNDVPWKHYIYNSKYSKHVDIYQGGMKYIGGIYHSESNSCMKMGIPYFNAISRQTIVERILNYAGEEFTIEKFYASDSQEWGDAATRCLSGDKATLCKFSTPVYKTTMERK